MNMVKEYLHDCSDYYKIKKRKESHNQFTREKHQITQCHEECTWNEWKLAVPAGTAAGS